MVVNFPSSTSILLLLQGRRNDFDIGEACLTNAKGASVKGESTRGVPRPLSLGDGVGASPEKILRLMTPVDAL